MTAEALLVFADRIAGAPAEKEKALFEEALTLFAGFAAREDAARWVQFLRCGAVHETAIAIYRAACGRHGFQFGRAARDGAAAPSRGLASSWRTGDAHAAVHNAATPALALLRAAACDSARRHDENRAAQCSVCGGLGWFTTPANGKHVCRHDSEAA
jgi:hypothetical protein